MEEKIDIISTAEGIDSNEIENVRSLLSELRSNVDNRNYDAAQSLLRTLTDALRSLENSVS